MLGLICTEHNFFYGAVHILPNKIYVPGLLTGRRKRRRSEEIVTGIYVPARGAGDPAGPAASAATAEAESARGRAAGAPRANLPSHLTAGIS